ncbi:MAG: hypothetical protein ABI548_27830 [Polyangiaceae bacterium]
MGAIDEILATIRRLPLPERLQLIEQAANEAAEDTPKAPAVATPRKLSTDELLATRLTPPAGVGSVRVEDMDHAIAKGALGPGNARAAALLGLMADEPDLVDQVCSLAYEARRTAHLRAVDE